MKLDNKRLGEKIRAVRRKRGLTQNTLAEAISCSVQFLSNIENGKKGVSLDTFLSIANALHVSTDALLMDSLENINIATNHELVEVISDCSEYELHIIIDVIIATKKSLRENHRFTNKRF